MPGLKLAAKKLDLLVVNDVTQEGAGFDGDTNVVTMLTDGGFGNFTGEAVQERDCSLYPGPGGRLEEAPCLTIPILPCWNN